MRPPTRKLDPVFFPLDSVLGRESHVRILRVVSRERRAFSVPDVAHRTQLTVQGTRKALSTLANLGVVVASGNGSHRLFQLRPHDAVSNALKTLFDAEDSRSESIRHSLHAIVTRLNPAPRSVWIESRTARESAVISIGVVHSAAHIGGWLRLFRKQAINIERQFDIRIEVAGYTETEHIPSSVSPGQYLFGFPLPGDRPLLAFPTPTSIHETLEERSRLRSVALVELLRKDPSLIPKTIRYLKNLSLRSETPYPTAFEEWLEILQNYSFARLSDFLVSKTERAARLRQSNPFFAVVDDAQRSAIRATSG